MGKSEERRQRLVNYTLKAGWAKFGAPKLDEATYEYIAGVACTVMTEVKDADAGEQELVDQLGPLLKEHNLKDRQVLSLSKAIARCVFPSKVSKENVKPLVKPEKSKKSDTVLCCVEDLILLYLGNTKLLLKDTTFELLKGHRYGIVGSNGAGKTTLMERIADGAIAELAKTNLRFVHIRHETLNERVDPATPAIDFARGVVSAGALLHDAFEQIGFTEELKQKPIRELSGGWRVRLLLVTAVAERADVLLLDEPTNHLDAAAVAWLVEYLTKDVKHATSLVVSHDAPFLNQICTDIIHFDECKLKYYAGNFSRFQDQAMLHDADEVRAVLQVRSAQDDDPALAARSVSASTSNEAGFRMTFPIPGKVEGIATTKKTVIDIKDTYFRYPMGKEYALRDVTCKVTMSSRIAIVGPNGAGKSTLMSLLCGEIRPTPDNEGKIGEVNRHRSLRLAYIAQNHVFHLADYARCTAVEYIQLRYRNGYDEELQKRLNSPMDENEEATLNYLASKYGKYGKRVEALVSRTKRKSVWLYEVQWQDLSDKQNTFETIAKLRQLGIERRATALDERLASVQAGTDERPLTCREIVKHFENFGLSEELVMHRPVGNYSGGQKSKLMIGAAFWTKPHLVCLDEPTNFLDFETVAALARALRNFRGGVIIVSHNEDFLASICNEIWSVQNNEVTVVKAEQMMDDVETS